MMEDDLVGLRLDMALERLASRGIDDVRVTETCAPRGKPSQGQLRVVRMTDGELLVAQFPDEVDDNIEAR